MVSSSGPLPDERIFQLARRSGGDVERLREVLRDGAQVEGFDPHWRPNPPGLHIVRWEVILCTYVANVLDEDGTADLVQALIDVACRYRMPGRRGADIYLTVRDDVANIERAARGGRPQRYVPDEEILGLGFQPLHHRRGSYRMFAMTPVRA